EPTEHDARLTVFLGERILPARSPGARTEQPSGVGPNHFTGEQPHVQFMHAWLRRHVEIAELAQQTRRRFGRDRHRLVAPSARNVVEIRDEPLVALAGPDPNGIRIEVELVAARDRRSELIKLRFNRLVGTRPDTYLLKL